MRAVSLGRQSFDARRWCSMCRFKVWIRSHVVRVVTQPTVRSLLGRIGRWALNRPILAGPIKKALRGNPRLGSRIRWLVLSQAPPTVRPHPQTKSNRRHVNGAAAERPRRPLRGDEADIDELMLRIEDELAKWGRPLPKDMS
jgi:hypothetical protein